MANKDFRPLEKKLKKMGFSVDRPNGGHIAITKDGVRYGTASVSSSDWRAIRNLICDLRRQGVPL